MCERVTPEPQLYLPACPECPSHMQKIYWRTYTYGTPETFGDSTAIDLTAARVDQKGCFIVDTSTLEKPGVIWASTALPMSMAVGITRYVFEGHDSVRLAGFSYCEHDQKEGVTAYDVYKHGPHFIMSELPPSEDHQEYIFSEGVVFSALNSRQLAGACHFEINRNMLESFKAKVALFNEPELLNRKKVYSELIAAFDEYFRGDFDRLAQMLREGIILQPGKSTNMHTDKLLNIFSINVEKMLADKRRLQEYRALGGDSYFQALLQESLQLLGRSETASPEWAIFYDRRRDEIADEIERWKDMIRW